MEKGELKPLTQILKTIPVNMDGKMRIGKGLGRKAPPRLIRENYTTITTYKILHVVSIVKLWYQRL